MEWILENTLATLGAFGLTAAVAGSVAYWAFTSLGDKWLESKFEKGLADAEHKHQRELESLKLEINKLFDRSTKLHQREFDVLPELW